MTLPTEFRIDRKICIDTKRGKAKRAQRIEKEGRKTGWTRRRDRSRKAASGVGGREGYISHRTVKRREEKKERDTINVRANEGRPTMAIMRRIGCDKMLSLDEHR